MPFLEQHLRAALRAAETQCVVLYRHEPDQPGATLDDQPMILAGTPGAGAAPAFCVGKGCSSQARIISAVMEVLERRAVIDTQAQLRSSFRKLSGAAVHPASHLHGHLRSGLEQLDLQWIQAQSLLDGRTWWLHRPAFGEVKGLYRTGSNGAAAGLDTSTAVTRGVLELLERDALLLHWRAQVGAPRLKVPTSGRAAEILAWMKGKGFTTRLYQTVAGLPVPAVLAVATCSQVHTPFVEGGTVIGSAAALELEEAMLGALLEIVQVLETALFNYRRGACLEELGPILGGNLAHDSHRQFAFLDHPGPGGQVQQTSMDALRAVLAEQGLDVYVYTRLVTDQVIVSQSLAPGLECLCAAAVTHPSARLQSLAQRWGTKIDQRPLPLG